MPAGLATARKLAGRVQNWRVRATDICTLSPRTTCSLLPEYRTAPSAPFTERLTAMLLPLAIIGISKLTLPFSSALAVPVKLYLPPLIVRIAVPPAGRPMSEAGKVSVWVPASSFCVVLPVANRSAMARGSFELDSSSMSIELMPPPAEPEPVLP